MEGTDLTRVARPLETMVEVARSLLPVPTVLCSIVFSAVRRDAWGFGRSLTVWLALFAGFAATALAAGRPSPARIFEVRSRTTK